MSHSFIQLSSHFNNHLLFLILSFSFLYLLYNPFFYLTIFPLLYFPLLFNHARPSSSRFFYSTFFPASGIPLTSCFICSIFSPLLSFSLLLFNILPLLYITLFPFLSFRLFFLFIWTVRAFLDKTDSMSEGQITVVISTERKQIHTIERGEEKYLKDFSLFFPAFIPSWCPCYLIYFFIISY